MVVLRSGRLSELMGWFVVELMMGFGGFVVCPMGSGDVFGDGISIGTSFGSLLDGPWTSLTSIVYKMWSDVVKYGLVVEEHR